MEDELKQKKFQALNARKISVGFLLTAFIIMAGWGFTPLKNVLPALSALMLFGACAIIAVAFTILGLYRDVQIKALKASIEDKE